MLLLLLFVSRVRVRICVAFFALFSGFLCLEFCLKDKRKTLARDDDDDDDVFSKDDDDDDEFGYVVLEITHQKTPITAC
jgi:hypothetical protein